MLRRADRATVAFDLSEPGHPRPHPMALMIARSERREFIAMRQRMRARPDQRHLTAQHVPELRKLVEARPTQPTPDRREARVLDVDLFEGRARIGQRPEFQNQERRAEQSVSPLSKQRGPWGGRPDHGGNQQEQRRQQNQSEGCQSDIQHTFQRDPIRKALESTVSGETVIRHHRRLAWLDIRDAPPSGSLNTT